MGVLNLCLLLPVPTACSLPRCMWSLSKCGFVFLQDGTATISTKYRKKKQLLPAQSKAALRGKKVTPHKLDAVLLTAAAVQR